MQIIFVLIVILFCQIFPAFSQTSKSSLSGVVTDTHGAVITEAKVVLIQMGNSRHSVETETDFKGSFIFTNLLPGKYLLKTSHTGFPAEREDLITVSKAKKMEVNIELGRACRKHSEGKGIVTNEDKAKVVGLTLNEAIDKLLADEARENGFILTTENIKREWIENIVGRKITLMNKENIQQKADREDDFLYMSFSEVRVRGACIAVSVNYAWAVRKNSQAVHLSGGGLTFEYRKELGKWVGKYVTGWVS